MKRENLLLIFIVFCLLTISHTSYSQDYGVAAVKDYKNILPERERAQIRDEWLKWRLDNIIPELMRREGIDMWLVICREDAEDPVFFSLMPATTMYASRTTILIFHDKGEEEGVERLTGSFFGIRDLYKSIYDDRRKNQMKNLAKFIKERNPQKIGINVSKHWNFGDGLSAALKEMLVEALDPEYSSRLVSAEHLCVGWLETRSPQELSVYRYICGIAHDMIAEFFSNKVIVPGITTTDDVVWWFRQKVTDLGLDPWFQPSCSIQRSKKDAEKYGKNNKVIHRGDLLHCDVGIHYLGLCTDTQQHAYVCRIGENDAPEGLKTALKNGNRLQDIFMNEFLLGRTGNDVLLTSLRKAKAEGLKPSIYTHPLGVHGHAAGTTLGQWDRQDGVPIRGDYPLHYNTCYAIELNNRYNVPEWNNQEVRIGLEEGGVFTKDGCKFIDGHQTKFYLIK